MKRIDKYKNCYKKIEIFEENGEIKIFKNGKTYNLENLIEFYEETLKLNEKQLKNIRKFVESNRWI